MWVLGIRSNVLIICAAVFQIRVRINPQHIQTNFIFFVERDRIFRPYPKTDADYPVWPDIWHKPYIRIIFFYKKKIQKMSMQKQVRIQKNYIMISSRAGYPVKRDTESDIQPDVFTGRISGPSLILYMREGSLTFSFGLFTQPRNLLIKKCENALFASLPFFASFQSKCQV